MVFLGKLSKSQNGMPEITNDIVTRQKYPNQLIGWAFTKEHLFNFKASHELRTIRNEKKTRILKV